MHISMNVFDSNISAVLLLLSTTQAATSQQDYIFVFLFILLWLSNNTQNVLFYKVKQKHWLGEVDY